MWTTSMNKPSLITIRSSSAPIGLWPRLIGPLYFTGCSGIFLTWTHLVVIATSPQQIPTEQISLLSSNCLFPSFAWRREGGSLIINLLSTSPRIVKSGFPMENVMTLAVYWYGKQHHAEKMHAKLLTRAREAFSSYSISTSWKISLERGEDIQPHAPGGGRLPDERIDVLSAATLEEAPFHSVRSLAKRYQGLSEDGSETFALRRLCYAESVHPSLYALSSTKGRSSRINTRIEENHSARRTLRLALHSHGRRVLVLFKCQS
jgi:hypothetical protein